MTASLTCPACGHDFVLVDPGQGQKAQCPYCQHSFPKKPTPEPSLLSRAAPGQAAPAAAAMAPNRTVLAQPEAMIRYTCPRCKKSLESPVSFAGQKLHCPDCNQRLQIPQPSTPPPAPPANKTVLALEEPTGQVAPAPLPPAPRTAPSVKVEVVEHDSPPVRQARSTRRETCLECGGDFTNRARVQSCPDCGSCFCSARCYRDHRRHAHARRKKRRVRYVECPRCGSTEPPYETTVISQGGWVVFAVLLILFFPLCWIGLLITETQLRCYDCGARLV